MTDTFLYVRMDGSRPTDWCCEDTFSLMNDTKCFPKLLISLGSFFVWAVWGFFGFCMFLFLHACMFLGWAFFFSTFFPLLFCIASLPPSLPPPPQEHTPLVDSRATYVASFHRNLPRSPTSPTITTPDISMYISPCIRIFTIMYSCNQISQIHIRVKIKSLHLVFSRLSSPMKTCG